MLYCLISGRAVLELQLEQRTVPAFGSIAVLCATLDRTARVT